MRNTREEHLDLRSKPAPTRYEVLIGSHRACKMACNLLDCLAVTDQEQARAAIETFIDRAELAAFPMHRAEVSLLGEKWTKIDGVKIFFFVDNSSHHVIFFLSIDEPDDDGDGLDCAGLIGGLDLDPATLQGEHSCQIGFGSALSAWSRCANEYAVDWVIALSRILFGDHKLVIALPALANFCLKSISGADTDADAVRRRKWRATILANDLYCHDALDIRFDLTPIVLDVPAAWLEEDPAASSSIGANASSVADAAHCLWHLASTDEILAELTLTEAPSGVCLLGLELACLVGRHYLSAYIQLAATGKDSSAAGRDRHSPPPTGRLRVRLRR